MARFCSLRKPLLLSTLMRFFSKFFLKLKPTILQNEVFGQMRLVTGKGGSHWECEGIFFLPENKSILFVVDTVEEQGPSQAQKDFVKEIEHRYPQLLQTWTMALEANIRNWIHDFHLSDMQTVFSLDAIEIPAEIGERPMWSITFQANDRIEPAWHYFNLKMEGWQVTEIFMDG